MEHLNKFHSELKTDLNLERLPSGKFATNDLVLHAGIFAYNLLRIMGQESIREDMCFLNGEQFQVKCGISYFQKTRDSPIRRKVQRRRIRTVIQN